MIIKNAHKMIDLMGNALTIILCPTLIKIWSSWKAVHRTLTDKILLILSSRKHIYLNHNGLEAAFAKNQESDSMQNSISEFKKCF
jgi:hypothetical protein